MSAIAVKSSPWCERLEKLVTDLDPEVGLEAIKKNVEAGNLTAFEVFVEEISIGFFIARIEVLYNNRRELVLIHAVSEVKGKTPLAHIFGTLLPELARKHEISTIRIHSEQRKLDDFLERQGFEFAESVFVKRI